MTPGERFKSWIDEMAQAWQERLKGWMAGWLSFGFDTFFKVLGTSMSPKLKPLIDKIEQTGEVPPEVQPLLEELKSPTGEASALIGRAAGDALIGGAVGKILDSILLPLAYAMNAATQYVMPGEDVLLAAWRRGHIKANELPIFLHRLGLEDKWVNVLIELSEIRLDPMTVINLLRRFPDKYPTVWKDLFDQGFDLERIEMLKDATLFYPNPQDLIRWQAREVFEPKMIQRYGLDSEYGEIEREPFYKAGMTDEQILNYWRAHWEHASWNQVVEMVRRGQMTEADVWDWFRLVEIPPFWRDKLIAISWAVPTRVDVRRFYDLKTIDEARLRELYTAQGYHGKDLDDYVLWTKIYVDLPDLLARWKNGWISLEQVRSALIADGMKPDAADELIQTKVKSVEPTSTAEGKELTKTEIYKGVKGGFITYDQGVDLLMDLDYSRDQADYLLATNVAVLTGSPEMYSDFKDITQKHRRAAGLEAKPVPEELKTAAADVLRITKELEELRKAVEEEKAGLVSEEVLPEAATKQLKSLQVTLHHAEASLAEAKSRYDKQLAIFHHQPSPPGTP